MNIDIRLDGWFRDSAGYRLLEHGKGEIAIVGKGGKPQAIEPINGTECVVFANVSSPTGLLGFVRRYGFLSAPLHGAQYVFNNEHITHYAGTKVYVDNDGTVIKPVENQVYVDGEAVGEHLEKAALFKSILGYSKDGWNRTPRSLRRMMIEHLQDGSLGTIGFLDDKKRGPRLTLTANSLLSAMWFQLATKIAGAPRFQSCALATCGRIFEVGSGLGRRLDARFCSDEHRVQHNSRSRSRARTTR